MKIALIAVRSWYLFNFRRSLIDALRKQGHTVVTVGARDAHTDRLRDMVDTHECVEFNSTGIHPLRELATVWSLRRLLRRQDVDVVLSFTPKGNIYSALALLWLKAALIVNVSGLGRAAALRQPVRSLVQRLYQYALARARWVYFQNDEDLRTFAATGLVDITKASRLPGSGVDLQRFRVPSGTKNVRDEAAGLRFLFVGRLLWEKGVGDFVEAARIVRAQHPLSRFSILGAIDPPNHAAVPLSTIEQWSKEGVMDYLGMTDDVASAMLRSDCVVLPSVYREGVPRTLLEAAAMERPVITNDSVGCRDAVDDGKSGFLCRPRDIADLASQMLRLIGLSSEQRAAMGRFGRSKMEREFDERLVIASYLQQLVGVPSRSAGR